MKVLVAQSCPSLWDPMDCSPPDSSVHGIFIQEYWSELPFPSPGDLPDPGIKPRSPALQADSERLLLNHTKTPGFLAPRGEEFNPGPETRLYRSELLCNKVLLKYQRDRESS